MESKEPKTSGYTKNRNKEKIIKKNKGCKSCKFREDFGRCGANKVLVGYDFIDGGKLFVIEEWCYEKNEGCECQDYKFSFINWLITP